MIGTRQNERSFVCFGLHCWHCVVRGHLLMTISMDKKYRTRDGRDVRLFCVDGSDVAPVCGLISGNNFPSGWSIDGRATSRGADDPEDLIEYHEPDIRTIWVNVYEDGVFAHNSKEKAEETADLNDRFRTPISIAQPVTFEVKRD